VLGSNRDANQGVRARHRHRHHGSGWVDEPDAFSQPLRGPGVVYFATGDSVHGFLGLVDVRWVEIPRAVVEVDEDDQRRPRCSFVAVGERMVPCQPTDEDGGLVVDVGVELDVTEPGPRSMQRRVSEIRTRRFRDGVGVDADDLLRPARSTRPA